MTLPLMQPNTRPAGVIQNPGIGGTIAEGIQQFGQNYLAAQQAAAQKEAEAEKARQERELGEFLRVLLTGGADAGVPGAQMGATQPVPVRDPKAPQADIGADQGPAAPSGAGMPDAGAPDAVGMEERFWAGVRKLDPKLITQAATAAVPFLAAERQRQAQLALAEQDRILNRFLPAIRSGELSVADALAQTPPPFRDEAAKLYGEAGKGRLEETKATQTDDTREYEFYVRGLPPGEKPLSFLEWQTKKRSAGATRVSTTNVLPGGQSKFLESFGSELGKDLVARRTQIMDRTVANVGSSVQRATDIAKAFTGLGADVVLTAARLTGIAPEKVKATQSYFANTAKEVGEIITMFGAGTGLSDADREYALAAAGGNITMTAGALRRIMRINAEARRNVIQNYLDEVDELKQDNPEFAKAFGTTASPASFRKAISQYDRVLGILDRQEGEDARAGAFGNYEGLKPVP